VRHIASDADVIAAILRSLEGGPRFLSGLMASVHRSLPYGSVKPSRRRIQRIALALCDEGRVAAPSWSARFHLPEN
jgi:hypothetical protein